METQDIISQILEHQKAHPQKEVCGFIVEVGGKKRAWPLSNVSEDNNTFILDPQETYNVFVAMNPVAVYHTHLLDDITPSEFDKKAKDLSCLPLWIVNQKGELNIND
jgi:proteasome lid subunit RPN8/RPN11